MDEKRRLSIHTEHAKLKLKETASLEHSPEVAERITRETIAQAVSDHYQVSEYLEDWDAWETAIHARPGTDNMADRSHCRTCKALVMAPLNWTERVTCVAPTHEATKCGGTCQRNSTPHLHLLR